jgi:YVTN family beta-propeller protein
MILRLRKWTSGPLRVKLGAEQRTLPAAAYLDGGRSDARALKRVPISHSVGTRKIRNGLRHLIPAKELLVASIAVVLFGAGIVGTAGLAQAAASRIPYAYVTNINPGGNGTVSVINTSTNTVVKTVPVGREPEGVAITPNGSYAYVANVGSGTVSVIKTSTDTVVKTVEVGGVPEGVAITPNGNYAYVTTGVHPGTVSVIKTSTNTLVKTVTVGSDPVAVAITPNGNYAYVANDGSGTVSVVNTSTNTVVKTVTILGGPDALAITPNGSDAYVSRGNVDVQVIKTSTDSVVNTVNAGNAPDGVAITANGNDAYVTDIGSRSVSVINTSTNTVVNTVPVGGEPVGVAITPNGSDAYVANEGSGTLSVIKISTDTVVKTVTVGIAPYAVAITTTTAGSSSRAKPSAQQKSERAKAKAKVAYHAGSNGAPSVASVESAVCAAAFPNGVSDGDHCAVTDQKVSLVDTNWVYGVVGEYNAQDQPDSDEGDVILNLSTHQLIGPTGEGFCGAGAGTPIPGYSSVPANVLSGLGLSPCSPTTPTTVPSTPTPPPTTPTTPTTVPSTPTLPPTTPTGVAPILGSAAWVAALGFSGEGIEGFGEVAPAAINAAGGNAPGSYVLTISWSNWGAPQAMGQGQSSYVSDPNAPLSDATQATVTVVAFDLGSCDGGPPAYQEVTWYFPQLGQTFDPTTATNACTGP